VRIKCPQITLTTDIIVGFPTEADEEFEDTLHVMRQADFDSAFMFKYSQRHGTIAERKYPDDVPENIKTERIVQLNELQKEISLKKNQAHIGEIHNILIENKGTKRSADEVLGRTDGNRLVRIRNNDCLIGEFMNVHIIDASANDLKGVAI